MHVGIDLGGTKIEVVALDAGGGERIRRRVPTPRGDYEAIVAAIAALVDGVAREIGPATSIGVGTPGAIDPASGLLRGSNTICLNGRPLARDLEAALGRAIVLANDANCFALSEALDGAASGAETVFGVILGTGVGAGLVNRGRVWAGRNGIAGEWGHNPMPWGAPGEMGVTTCYCGLRDCIETYLSGPGFEADFARASGAAESSRAIAEGARTGDAACIAALERYHGRLARALAHVVNILDPDIVVLGGGMSQIVQPDIVMRSWGRWVFSRVVATRVVRHGRGDSSGVRGAAFIGAQGRIVG